MAVPTATVRAMGSCSATDRFSALSVFFVKRESERVRAGESQRERERRLQRQHSRLRAPSMEGAGPSVEPRSAQGRSLGGCPPCLLVSLAL